MKRSSRPGPLMRIRVLVALLLAGSMPSLVRGQSHAPLGPEFQVNTVTTGNQWIPAVAHTSSGGFVVVWRSPDGSEDGVFARRFDAAGAPEGAMEFRVNAYTTGFVFTPAVAALPDDGFVVVWDGEGEGDSSGVFAHRYDGSLVPQGPSIVNEYTTGGQRTPDVAAAASGDFIVSWTGAGGSFGDYQVYARAFDSSGLPLAHARRINTYTTGHHVGCAVAGDRRGNFVVAWNAYGQDGDGYGIFARRYDSGGPTSNELAVNAFTTGFQVSAEAAVRPDGAFLIAWHGPAAGSGTDVFARRYNVLGAPQGTTFLVNEYRADNQISPQAAVDSAGNFVIVWDSYGSDGSGWGVLGRAFDASGTPLGGEFALNAYTTGHQRGSAIAASPDGGFLAVWHGEGGQDGSQAGVFARHFIPDPIFADGFDSGSTVAWSFAATDGDDLSVSALAAMGSSAAGLRALIDDTAGLYVQDDTPEDEDRYRARFYFDPNGFDPGEAQEHRRTRIFIVFEDGPRRLAAVVLRRLAGEYSLRARARRDDDSQADTPFIPITDAPHVVELEWRRSSGPDALDGSLELWIDGTSVALLTGLDNSISSVDHVRMGALSVKAGAAGTMYWDQFASRRINYIGP